ncbi:inorganic diphosphatase [Candidatus Peregrinibacteria bacterium CG10_big_fil_rev_8_21_14_0_10_49_24]|nr:MAG: inorganic diphosphatase [Candidatus Peregrinibacteria bacterium CG11_big_fil_rev_8_21_14_0_20_49_14]PIR51249.1 MAG: inorganic diphosphatase [Candidatus Peregrinibacteria bacterium CG10_big_fil_rev_8_21_14_0_10_49_24]PJA67659.1 MAG: inorganic diphosphatase [Candidatus Peregrinibacteria bacterium CG_4_9_14_3_um_filter_49_12]
MTTGNSAPKYINVIVEIPQGSRNKYEFDKESGIVKLDRVLRSSVHYPGEYGIIPGTLAGDGDALDAIVLMGEPTYPGILIESRPIGVLMMQDGGEQDDKILAVPVSDASYEEIEDITDLSSQLREEIAEFFRTYKNLEGKRVKVLGWKNAEQAKEVILEAMVTYHENQ